ncbi:hypothetical protein [Ferrovibrio xuzhouensis]|uniref:Uncharacterized protein n=1 Tax=Ferrovibrio xuzhouensis TaxID=1576914 RepID=A0ABV7VLN6_9PROT
MDAYADKPIIRDMRVRQGETIKLPNDGPTMQEITCDDIARLALAMHDHSYFFSLCRGLSIRFSRDLNGSGTQGLYITKKSDETNPPHLIQVFFDYTYEKDGEFLYEADLIMDKGKDYEPTVNRGKHRFVANSAAIQIDWNSDETQQWRSDIERLSRSPDTLSGWIEDDLEMLVRCGSGYFCRKPAILTKNDLKRYVAAGLSLEGLKTRLKCTKCGKRGARVTVF